MAGLGATGGQSLTIEAGATARVYRYWNDEVLYTNRFIADAGGAYLWADHPSSQAVPMDLESVYARAVNAEIWINPGAAASLDNLRDFDPRLKNLKVVRSGRVYNNNARMNESGGNDYWESGAVRPDLVLHDLIKVFHPDLMTDHPFIYYRQLK